MYCYRHPDRETGVSCSECGRGICPDCMVFAPVGIRCPEHAGVAQGAARVTTGVRRAAFEGGGALVTKTLIGLNVLVFFLNLAQGSSLNRVSGSLFEKGALYIGTPSTIGLASGEWWRLITAAFLHGSLIHLGMNMLMLWFVGVAGRAGDRARALPRASTSSPGSPARRARSSSARTRSRSARRARSSGSSARHSCSRRSEAYVLGGRRFGLIAINLVLTFAGSRTSRSAATSAGSSAARSACSRCRASAARTRSTGDQGCSGRRPDRRRRGERAGRLPPRPGPHVGPVSLRPDRLDAGFLRAPPAPRRGARAGRGTASRRRSRGRGGGRKRPTPAPRRARRRCPSSCRP